MYNYSDPMPLTKYIVYECKLITYLYYNLAIPH